MPSMAECTKTHPNLHLVTGVGLGLLLVAWVPALAENLVVLGLVLVVASVVGHFFVK